MVKKSKRSDYVFIEAESDVLREAISSGDDDAITTAMALEMFFQDCAVSRGAYTISFKYYVQPEELSV